MDNDDRQIGRLLSRRKVIKLMGATGLVLMVSCNSDDEPANPSQSANPTAASNTAPIPPQQLLSRP